MIHKELAKSLNWLKITHNSSDRTLKRKSDELPAKWNKDMLLVAAALLSAVLCRDNRAQNVLASFNSTNGACPNAGLILSGSTLYGTTQIGGAPGGIQGYGNGVLSTRRGWACDDANDV